MSSDTQAGATDEGRINPTPSNEEVDRVIERIKYFAGLPRLFVLSIGLYEGMSPRQQLHFINSLREAQTEEDSFFAKWRKDHQGGGTQ